jgi:hypothetical protein
LYIKSSKKTVGIEETGAWGYVGGPGIRPGGARIIKDYKVQRKTRYEYLLTDEQRKATSIVENLAREYGFRLRIVDVGMQGSARRFVAKYAKRIKVFPTLFLDSGVRFEAAMTVDNLRAFMSKNRPNDLL